MTKAKTKPVSVRLPDFIVDILDEEAEKRDTNRTDVIRRAIVTLQESRRGVLVPLDESHRRSLYAVSKARRIPYTKLLSDWICQALERAGEEKIYHQYTTVNHTMYVPVESDNEKGQVYDVS